MFMCKNNSIYKEIWKGFIIIQQHKNLKSTLTFSSPIIYNIPDSCETGNNFFFFLALSNDQNQFIKSTIDLWPWNDFKYSSMRAHYHLSREFDSHSWRDVLLITLCYNLKPWSLSVTCDRLVFFPKYYGILHQYQ